MERLVFLELHSLSVQLFAVGKGNIWCVINVLLLCLNHLRYFILANHHRALYLYAFCLEYEWKRLEKFHRISGDFPKALNFIACLVILYAFLWSFHINFALFRWKTCNWHKSRVLCRYSYLLCHYLHAIPGDFVCNRHDHIWPIQWNSTYLRGLPCSLRKQFWSFPHSLPVNHSDFFNFLQLRRLQLDPYSCLPALKFNALFPILQTDPLLQPVRQCLCGKSHLPVLLGFNKCHLDETC